MTEGGDTASDGLCLEKPPQRPRLTPPPGHPLRSAPFAGSGWVC